MVITSDDFDSRGGGRADADEEVEEEVVEDTPVEEVSDDNSEAVVKILEKVEKAQRTAANALGKLGEKDLVTGVNAQRNDIEAAIVVAKKG